CQEKAPAKDLPGYAHNNGGRATRLTVTIMDGLTKKNPLRRGDYLSITGLQKKWLITPFLLIFSVL
ncbi:MAG: hypothetical protein WA253_07225, partial [Gammaproteobacteria bacterium]